MLGGASRASRAGWLTVLRAVLAEARRSEGRVRRYEQPAEQRPHCRRREGKAASLTRMNCSSNAGCLAPSPIVCVPLLLRALYADVSGRRMSKVEMGWNFQLPGPIEWRIDEKIRAEVDVGPLPGWKLVTPLGMLKAPIGHLGFDVLRRLPSGELWISDRVLALRFHGAAPEQGHPPAMLAAAKVLQAMRYLARQFALPDQVIAYSGHALQAGPPIQQISTEDCSETLMLRDYFLSTAVTAEHLEQLASLPPDFVVPAPAAVMLDALHAHVAQDFRKALLYAAIAAEAMASTRLDVEYKRILRARGDRFRVVDLAGAKGALATKDPIYDCLRKSDNFGRLLHERPLYLLGRSLRVEDEPTYTRAIKLYATRSKLAHTGTVPPSNQATFELSEDGAREGLRTAIKIMEWFGDAGPYVAGWGFVSLGDWMNRRA